MDVAVDGDGYSLSRNRFVGDTLMLSTLGAHSFLIYVDNYLSSIN